MTDKRGQEHSRSFLQYQAETLILLGDNAVPELIRWLPHDEAYVRYLAAYSLREITGENPTFYHFARPGESFNADDKWYERCVETWRGWYQRRRTGDAQSAQPSRATDGTTKGVDEADVNEETSVE
jgi:hypothetical protein